MTTDRISLQPCEECGKDAEVGLEHGKKWLCWSHWLVSPDYQTWSAERMKESRTNADDLD